MTKPLIGITTAVYIDPRSEGRYHRAYAPNVQAVKQAGGVPILIPCDLDNESLRALYERVDGILLPGGGDVDPRFYKANPHPKTALIDAGRDEIEIQLTRWAAEEKRPLFAICRGHQVVNVALGGTLLQDIPSLIETSLKHDHLPWEAPRSMIAHPVAIEPQSRLAKIVGVTDLPVNSLHHQSIEQLAPGLQITAHSPDGIIEGTELPGDQFFVTVQWHPEDLTDRDDMQNLFVALVNAAANYA